MKNKRGEEKKMKEKGGAPFFPVTGMGLASGKSLLL